MGNKRASGGFVWAFAAVGLLLAVLVSAVRADLIEVHEGESIQAAIEAANDGDVILVHPGTFCEQVDFIGKAIWLISRDGAEATVISSPLGPSAVRCVSGEGNDTILDGFTITREPYSISRGMFNWNSSPIVRDCIFTGLFALDGDGGGMRNRGSSPVVVNCTFTGNACSTPYGNVGGGMSNEQSSEPIVINCSFIGNSATWGGAVASWSSDPTFINCLFVANSAEWNGGAIEVASGATTVINSVVWGNTPDQIEGGPSVEFSNVMGGYTGIGNINADPLFADPANGDLRLLLGSPCIDSGNSDAVPMGILTDLDGNPRFIDDPCTIDTGFGTPPIVDMGAYEYQAGQPCPCPADINGDGTVDVTDLLHVLAEWGQSGVPEDINGDGVVDVLDMLEILAAWGPCP